MAQKKSNFYANDAPPTKLPLREGSTQNSDFQIKLLRDQITERDKVLIDRERKIALKQQELNAEKENSRRMQADYEDQLKKRDALLKLKVCYCIFTC
jgi:hypothetical protein